ncbi:DAK2 domain-containing protein [uncultured Fenollaria sp.]|uniref:DAK2 domain-containing protein n=1 Tax=uncultured Fenollaria sp. TaxID=1686315 RepID=UPI0025E06AD8|nr:DAK2 domain-containing protein [uncultured Fenollaria sp.]
MSTNKIDAIVLKKALIGALNSLGENKEVVDALNVFPVPDGDTGTNMLLTMKSAVTNAVKEENKTVKEISSALSKGALLGARGNSGVILSQLLRGFKEAVEDKEYIDIEALMEAFVKASEVAYKAVMRPTEGTILTVSKDLASFASKNYRNYTELSKFADDSLIALAESLNRTPELLSVLKEAGVVDAGGKGLYCILKGAIEGARTENLEITVQDINKTKQTANRKEISTDNIKYGYCTEFIITGDTSRAEEFKETISKIGDSMVVVALDDIIKCHIHSNNPGQVIEEALKLGYLKDIKIDNMRLQHNEILFSEEEYKNTEKEENKPKEHKKYGFIAVSSGEGFTKIFKDLKVDEVVTGGQTMNPSTEDFMEAIDKINADDIFIFPNNKNIIMAAKQTIDLSEKNIHVVETRNMPEAITAMITFDEDMSADEILDNMNEAISEVKTGEVTFAVRDTTIDGKEIKKGNYLAIRSSKILASSADLNETTMAMIDELIDEDTSLVTLYLGEDAEKALADDLIEKLEEKYPDVDFEAIESKQALYYYIISLE